MIENSLMRIAALHLVAAFLLSCDGTGTGIDGGVPVAALEVIPGTATVEIGRTVKLNATPKDASGDNLQRRVTWAWTSSDTSVASVNGHGAVTGVSEGTAIITATSEGVEGVATVDVITPGVRICLEQSQLPHAECWALVRLFEDTNGRRWDGSARWLENTNPCGWYGVGCGEGRVTSIRLEENGLTGMIPTELGGLRKLHTLDLWSNQLSGPVPAELGNLEDLRSLNLWFNELSGPIPVELGSLSNLEVLYLHGNRLTGTIPPQLGGLTSLRQLWLASNQLTGSIPPDLGALSSLQRLFLGFNQLTGPIPPELGSLSEVWALDLGNNELTGPIPTELANLTNLEWLTIWGNQLAGLMSLNVAQHLGQLGYCKAKPGNDDLTIPDTEEYRGADMDGDGQVCGIEFVPTVLSMNPPMNPARFTLSHLSPRLPTDGSMPIPVSHRITG